ncbi:hypothetical protein BKH41_04065 [Helicobacter sp. 12S02232-10]|uniref:hypothetical protein n=1 Tax=Helicobacter sp. 12S02232-10 TaxID=1476197 RepID=UPI000BA4EBAA|nr:hypothetical protein [Helicobacter sp. 12S02232-10]PAF48811.1 hypothetical protein BKH41_04065 [Helicobacter sp. 12S02232-10]
MENKTEHNPNSIKRPRHHNKTSRLVARKQTKFILDLESYQNLKKQSRENNLTMTKFLETLLKEKSLQNSSGITKIIALTNFNQKFYMDLNTTFSNLNQIAYNLNLDKFLEESKIDNAFLKNIADELITTKTALQDLRLLTLKFLLYLEIDNKKQKKIQKRIETYKEKYEKEMAKNQSILNQTLKQYQVQKDLEQEDLKDLEEDSLTEQNNIENFNLRGEEQC